MARLLYSFAFYLLMPLVLARLAYRAWKAPAYAERLAERFGHVAKRNDSPVWIHAVSVGETVAIAPLVELLLTRQPERSIVLTTTTPTGAARVKALFGDQVQHYYCPYDLPHLVARFIKRVQPIGLIIVETELWPNLVHQCHSRKVPVMVANARLSARSARGYQKFSALTHPMLRQINRIAAQNNSDGQRFIELGLPTDALTITGSIKFDTDLPEGTNQLTNELQQQWGEHRKVIVAGSTHDGEDQMLLQCFQQLQRQQPDALLVLVPRHPERFDQVYKLSKHAGFSTKRRSSEQADNNTEVYIGDTMGELVKLYAAADICFVGGSLVANGGHNPLEPALLGKPVLMGKATFNFAEICQQLEKNKGLVRVEGSQALLQQWQQLLADPQQAQQMGQNAREYLLANQGALEQLYQLVCSEITEPAKTSSN